FFSDLETVLALWPAESWAALIDLLGEVANGAPAEAQAYLRPILAELFASDSGLGVTFAAERRAAVPASLRDIILAELVVPASSASPEVRASAFDALVGIDPDDASGQIRAALVRAIN